MGLGPTVTTSSIYIESSVSYGRVYERSKLNSKLLGRPLVDPRGGVPTSQVIDQNLTGTNESPSWTHASIGVNQAFVGVALSSSHYEMQVGNYFLSGTEGVELSPVPASASLYYSKKSGLRTITVKHTASILDTAAGAATNPISQGKFVPSVFAPLTGALINMVTGSSLIHLADAGRPAVIRLDVPVNGKLVDIKVWVEIVHLSGSPNREWPLTNLGIALKCPNLTWGNSVPIRNDAALQRLYTSDPVDYIGPSAANNPYSSPISYFYRDTFILWESWCPYWGVPFGAPSVIGEATLNITNGDILSYWGRHYPQWNRDRGMRTVFADGASVPNPRHLNGHVSSNYAGSPNAGANGAGPTSAWGNNVPWTSDRTVFPATESYQAAGSPPVGWLSGPGGAADVNEWPTTGVNYGTNYIRPLYPLLDPIFQKKIVGDEAPQQQIQDALIDPSQWRGYRPGLRGVEISGSWELLLMAGAGTALGAFGGGSGTLSACSSSAYFRQARLEITYEVNLPGIGRRSDTSKSPRRSGPKIIHRMSGSDFFFANFDGVTYQSGNVPSSGTFDWYVSENYTDFPGQGEIGRTFGLRLNSGSFNSTNFALIYRLTGTLADQVGQTPGWLTNNQFGMPAIPVSSASLAPPVQVSSSDVVVVPPSTYIAPQKSLDGARRLADVAADVKPPLSRRLLAVAFVSASSI